MTSNKNILFIRTNIKRRINHFIGSLYSMNVRISYDCVYSFMQTGKWKLYVWKLWINFSVFQTVDVLTLLSLSDLFVLKAPLNSHNTSGY